MGRVSYFVTRPMYLMSKWYLYACSIFLKYSYQQPSFQLSTSHKALHPLFAQEWDLVSVVRLGVITHRHCTVLQKEISIWRKTVFVVRIFYKNTGIARRHSDTGTGIPWRGRKDVDVGTNLINCQPQGRHNSLLLCLKVCTACNVQTFEGS
jgi:hypothetical protein